MPRISEFYGIVIAMFYNEHGPPHFHANYGGYAAVVGIDPIGVLRARMPRRALSMVIEWAAIHQQELKNDWERAARGLPLVQIQPLR